MLVQRFGTLPCGARSLARISVSEHRLSSTRSRICHSIAAAAFSQTQSPQMPPSGGIWEQLTNVYDAALAQQAGGLFKTETDDKVVHDQQHGVDFVLRVATALNSKPRATDGSGGGKRQEKPANPFLPHEEALFVCDLSSSHKLLLNKFNVVAHHSLVVTQRFEHQTDPLNAQDFDAALQVLQAMPLGGVVFYNCGPVSGASQPHKHLQAVPLPLTEGSPARPPFEHILADSTAKSSGSVAELRQLPFRTYAACFGTDSVTGAQLAGLADSMLATCMRSCGGGGGAEPLSYNVLLMQGGSAQKGFLQMIPRSAECSGPVAVNSLGPAGTFFVKSSELLRYIEDRTPMQVLRDVGFDWN